MELIKNLFKGDKVVWVVFMLLCLTSIIEVFSAASTLVYTSGDHWAPIRQHCLFLIVGALIVLGVQHVPLRAFKLAPIVLIISWGMLLRVMIKGAMTNGAARWIDLGFRFQPSELTKMALVITTAIILAFMQEEKGASRKAFKYIMWMTVPSIALIAPENLSTALLLFGVVFLMMFIGRVPFAQLGKLAAVLLAFGAVALTFLIVTPDETLDKIPMGHRFTTWKHRIVDHTDDNTKEIRPEDLRVNDNLQTNHANIAIASSNIIGKGPGNSKERDFLPQAYSDFIYAIILEELGLAGGFVIIFLYIILLIRTSKIANKCDKDFPALLAIGVTLLIVSQALINMMVAVGLFPVTGQPLPLISRGGTSTLINCMYIGIILSVSRYNNLQQEKQKALQEGNMQEVERLEDINKGLENEEKA